MFFLLEGVKVYTGSASDAPLGVSKYSHGARRRAASAGNRQNIHQTALSTLGKRSAQGLIDLNLKRHQVRYLGEELRCER